LELRVTSPILSLKNATKVFTESGGRIELFRDLDFELGAGEFVAITGASGVGKSTLLHILGLLEQASSGTLRFDGTDVSTLGDARVSRLRNRSIGFVFQFHHLLPDLTALENVMLPLRIGGSLGGKGRARAKELLERVGLGDRLHHVPAKLSGGERQRAAVARALVNGPSVLLCDEPSGNLDAGNAERLHALLSDLNRDQGVAVLAVTHDPALAARAHRALVLRGGALQDAGAPST
jgi:lipoprotein-releasing system ATP-binding protein